MALETFKKRLFRLHRTLDWISVLSISVLTFPWPFVLAVPFALVLPLKSLILGKRLRRKRAQELRSIWSLPWNVRLRLTNKDDCHVQGGLFFSVLFVTKGVADQPNATNAMLKISHELGHHGRMDHAVYTMILWNIILLVYWLFGIAYTLFAERSLKVDGQVFFTIFLILLLGFVISGLDVRRTLNFRELHADDHAFHLRGEEYLEALDRLAFVRRFMPRGLKWFVWFFNAAHPPPEARIRFLVDPKAMNGLGKAWWLLPGFQIGIAFAYLSSDPFGTLALETWESVQYIAPLGALLSEINQFRSDVALWFFVAVSTLGMIGIIQFIQLRQCCVKIG